MVCDLGLYGGCNCVYVLCITVNTYIMKALINARTMFGTPVDNIPNSYPTMQDYLFDKHLLTEGEPPNDRGCRICSKIGHFARECPKMQARKERYKFALCLHAYMCQCSKPGVLSDKSGRGSRENRTNTNRMEKPGRTKLILNARRLARQWPHKDNRNKANSKKPNSKVNSNDISKDKKVNNKDNNRIHSSSKTGNNKFSSKGNNKIHNNKVNNNRGNNSMVLTTD